MRRPFWAHQMVEYLVGIVLIAAAIQQPQPAVPALLGLVVILNAAAAKGGAGAFALVGRRLHRQLDLVVMALLLAAAIQPWVSLDNTSRFMMAAIALVLFFVWFHTDFTERLSRKERKEREHRPDPAPRQSAPRNRAAGSKSDDIGRGAGRMVGKGINSAKRWKDSFDDARTDD